MAVINITDQADREFVEDHEEVAHTLKRYSARERQFRAQANADLAIRDTVAVRVRRGLVRYKGALDGVLEAQLTDFEIQRDTVTSQIIALHTNADAQAYRDSLSG
jgi:hypothetical protein